MHQKIPIIKVVTTTFTWRWENTASAMMAMAMFQEKWGNPRFAVFPTTVAKNGKHDLLFFSWGFCRDGFMGLQLISAKTQRAKTTVCVDSFLFLMWIGSLCSLFFSGVISKTDWIAPSHFVWDPRHLKIHKSWLRSEVPKSGKIPVILPCARLKSAGNRYFYTP